MMVMGTRPQSAPAKGKGFVTRRRRDIVSNYMATHVDPLMHEMITYLLLKQPEDVRGSMLEYLRNPTKCEVSRKVSRKDRIYMVSEISPVLTELLTDVVRARPRKPSEFMIGWLSSRVRAKLADAIAKSKVAHKKILVLGPSGAGKTTLLMGLAGDPEPKPKPTSGFRKYEFEGIAFYDLSGKPKAQRSWVSYFHDVHAVMFVVDSSNLSGVSFDLDHPMIVGKPLLVVANNKQDLNDCGSVEEVAKKLGLETYQHKYKGLVAACACVAGTRDERLDKGLEWLGQKIDENAAILEDRVQADTKIVAERDAENQRRKEERVFRKVLRKAFSEPPEECFSREEGLDFFKNELGAADLPAEAVHLAEICNYQKLALQMMGNFKCPISVKKRTPMDWSQILAYVNQRKKEAWDDVFIAQDNNNNNNNT
ncbi:hypothetical protein CTAYLR_000588 [Chrysophaeum taylorii]|uniref:Uncharacterized protein n=1 Tax=Chrysophaeum taylorii TaxID=2483200 RepID=A0AAD7UID0_9STRA|nr:hypothetical protein CTAYLR_000588 [Chrysophaeum taylorii]